MHTNNKCPVCGYAAETDSDRCPVCDWESLQRYLRYKEQWQQQIRNTNSLQSSGIRLFAGRDFGLILTPDGDLYGIGCNEEGQIGYTFSDCDKPYLMAREVISAAAGNAYSIYVTKDGQVHLQGKGELADRFPGFSGAAEVYATSGTDEKDGPLFMTKDCFWIRTVTGGFFCFGDNMDMRERSENVWKQYPEEAADIHSGIFVYPHTTGFTFSSPDSLHSKVFRALRNRIERSEDYLAALECCGGGNVQLVLNDSYSETEPCKPFFICDVGATKYYYPREVVEMDGSVLPRNTYYYCDHQTRYTFRPTILVSNDVLYSPIPCPQWQWLAQTPHRTGSLPIRLPDAAKAVWNGKGTMACIGLEERYWMWLHEDGTLTLSGDKQPAIPTTQVAAMALSDSFFIAAYEDGQIRIANRKQYSSLYYWWKKIVEDDMTCVTLPEQPESSWE